MPDARRSLISGDRKMHLNHCEAIRPVQKLAARARCGAGTLNVPREIRADCHGMAGPQALTTERPVVHSAVTQIDGSDQHGGAGGRASTVSVTDPIGTNPNVRRRWAESDEVREGDQAAEPHGAPLEIGVNRGTDGAGRCRRAWRCRQIALPVMPRVGRELDRAVGADRDRCLPP